MIVDITRITLADIPPLLDAINAFLLSTSYQGITTNIYLTTEQLARRWEISVSRLNQYRVIGSGPAFMKTASGLRAKVRYPLFGEAGLLAYEKRNTFTSTTECQKEE